VGLGIRKSKKLGPFRITGSGSGISTSVGGRGFRLGRTARGRKSATFRIGGWMRRKTWK
jgi:hypothetical protein